MRGTKQSKLIGLAIAAWAIVIGAGMVWITDYEWRPGTASSAVSLEGPDAGVTGKPKLTLILHPRCPCSRATIKGTEKLIQRNPNRLSLAIYFYKPSNEPDDWVKTDLWETAKALPRAEVKIVGDAELVKYISVTSGQAFLESGAGELIFSGGLTAGRAQDRDSVGIASIESYLRTGQATETNAPVYGCIITSPSEG